jgi:site-specific recombinase XerD
MKVRDLYDPYLRRCQQTGMRAKTIERHQRQIDAFIDPTIGHIPLRKLTLATFDAVVERARPFGISCPRTAMMTVRMMLWCADENGYKLPINWRGIRVPKYRPQRSVQILDKLEVEIVRGVLSTNTEIGLRNRTLFEVLLHTGLRISEACNALREKFDPLREELEITNAKTRERETVYTHGATEWLTYYLAERTDNHPALFYVPKSHQQGDCALSVETAKSLMRKIKRDTGITKFGWHVVRKTFCTNLLRAGVDLKTVQYLARHESEITTLKHYIETSHERGKSEHHRVMEALQI